MRCVAFLIVFQAASVGRDSTSKQTSYWREIAHCGFMF